MTPERDAPVAELREAESLVYVEDLEHPALCSDDEHHLLRVLRLRAGARVAVSDGRGRYRMTELVRAAAPGAHRPETALELTSPVREVPALLPPVAVAFAVPKGDRYELVVQKLTELGIDRIVPLETRRSVARPAAGTRRSRLERVVREASSQSRRVRLPELGEPVPLGQLLDAAPLGLAVAEPGGGSLAPGTTTIVVGPEGGFEPGEIPDATARLGLGPTVLRAETAAIAAGVLLSLARAGLLGAGSEIR